jgi:hypothetical protein
VLGLERKPESPRDVKRAYAALLKKIDPDAEPQQFTKLREAYEYALVLVDQGESPPNPAGSRLDADTAESAPDDAPEPRPTAHPEEPGAPKIWPSAPPPLGLSEPSEIVPADHPVGEQRKMETLLGELGTQDLPLHSRLEIILSHPVSWHEPFASRIRKAIAAEVLSHFVAEPGRLELSRVVTGECVRLLDSRYQWLSDYRQFEQDFGERVELAQLLAARSRQKPTSQRDASENPWQNQVGRHLKSLLLYLAYLALTRSILIGVYGRSTTTTIFAGVLALLLWFLHGRFA